jgi:hypothetical protein
MLKKAKSKRGSIFNCLIFIKVFRELSKHTTYMTKWGNAAYTGCNTWLKDIR